MAITPVSVPNKTKCDDPARFPKINPIVPTISNKSLNVKSITGSKSHTAAMKKATVLNRSQQFFNNLLSRGVLYPGSQIARGTIERMLGVSTQKCMSEKDWTNYSLGLLGPVGFTRDELLEYGLYFGQHDGDYRVMDKSETHKAIKGYVHKSKNACGRAIVLNKNLPDECNRKRKEREKDLKLAYDLLQKWDV